jgi:hypothetical protein
LHQVRFFVRVKAGKRDAEGSRYRFASQGPCACIGHFFARPLTAAETILISNNGYGAETDGDLIFWRFSEVPSGMASAPFVLQHEIQAYERAYFN